MATELRDWVPQALAAADRAGAGDRLKKAEAWLKDVQADMRAERFRPIADRARPSGRQLAPAEQRGAGGRSALRATATRRSVALDVTVDGVTARPWA